MGRRFGIPRRISRALNRRLLAFVARAGLPSFITLETRGRTTGRPHRVVLPVVPASARRIFAVSSYGRQSDWWRNAVATPRVRITRDGQTYDGTVRTISWQEFRRGMGDSAKKGTAASRWLSPLVRLAFLVRARISGVVVSIER
ncbi:MAG: nitroreductase family deazaflavin-dependent oxidoreductase [Thermoplasmata archaeon]